MKSCFACGKNVKLFAKIRNDSVYKCPNCGLGFTDKLKKQIGDYHRDIDYIKNQQQFENIYRNRFNIIKKYILKPGKILEIGSSTGLLLSIFKKEGWEILGIEMSKESAEFAREKNIPTLITSFEFAKLPRNSFNVVILNHTLEHLTDPSETIKKINTLLAKDGLLFIDVPNFGGLSAKLYGKHWPYLLPNEHLWHFTLDSLEKILKKAGFIPIYHETSSGIWDYASPFGELWQSFIGFKKRFIINFLTFLPTFIISKLNLGSGLIIISKKIVK